MFLLSSLGLNFTKEEVADIHQEMDLNGDAGLDLQEISKFVGTLRTGRKPGPSLDSTTLTITKFDPRVTTFRPRRGDWTGDRGRRTLKKLMEAKLVGSDVVYQHGEALRYGEPNFRPVPASFHQ